MCQIASHMFCFPKWTTNHLEEERTRAKGQKKVQINVQPYPRPHHVCKLGSREDSLEPREG